MKNSLDPDQLTSSWTASFIRSHLVWIYTKFDKLVNIKWIVSVPTCYYIWLFPCWVIFHDFLSSSLAFSKKSSMTTTRVWKGLSAVCDCGISWSYSLTILDPDQSWNSVGPIWIQTVLKDYQQMSEFALKLDFQMYVSLLNHSFIYLFI